MLKKLLTAVAVLTLAAAGGWIGATSASPVTSAADPIPAGYVPLAGGRIFDARGPSGVAARPTPGATFTIATGRTGAAAVAVNITMTDTVGPGFVAAWASGPWPGTSIMNSSVGGENIANFAIIPVAADGTFQLLTQQPAHLIVDLMGWLPGSQRGSCQPVSPPRSPGTGPATASPAFLGMCRTATLPRRMSGSMCDACNGTVKIDYVFDIPAGATRGFDVLCDGLFTSGASANVVEIWNGSRPRPCDGAGPAGRQGAGDAFGHTANDEGATRNVVSAAASTPAVPAIRTAQTPAVSSEAGHMNRTVPVAGVVIDAWGDV
jgi:hypothetical protein